MDSEAIQYGTLIVIGGHAKFINKIKNLFVVLEKK